MRDLLALPKAHLHLHLEGAMRPATLTELADRYTIALEPTPAFGSFAVFIDTYTASSPWCWRKANSPPRSAASGSA
jgi:adenosine deaminase